MTSDESEKSGDHSVTDLEEHKKINKFVADQCSRFEYECDIQNIYAVGDFGSKCAIPGKSDLEILITVIFKNTNEIPSIKKEKLEHTLSSNNFGRNFTKVRNMKTIVSILEDKNEIIQRRASQYDYYYDIVNDEYIQY